MGAAHARQGSSASSSKAVRRSGEPFFSLLRQYHLALVPTQGTEEPRVAFDALASGCVLVHSNTPTLSAALEPLRGKTWRHA